MARVEVSTIVYIPPAEAYAFLRDFPRYARYSEHLREVRRFGDGDPGTEYELEFAWWKLTYTARSRVTDVDPPERIDWRVVKDLDAAGRWKVEPVDDPEAARPLAGEPAAHHRPDGDHPVTRVTFTVEYRPESADPGGVDLPRFVSLDWVVEKVAPKIQTEAERVVRRIVEDLEGEDREVDLEVRTGARAVDDTARG